MTSSKLNIENAAHCDSTLVALAKAGDAPAIDRLVRKYWPAVYRKAARILRCHADAEETAQDVLYSALSHLSTFRGDASFRTWIYRITVNQSLMAMRRNHRRAACASPVPVEQAALFMGGARTPEEVLLDSECRAVVEEGIGSLPERYVAVLQLSIFEGKSTSEIATSVGVSPGAAKTRLHRGRARLQDEVRRHLRLNVAEKVDLGERGRQQRPAHRSKCAG